MRIIEALYVKKEQGGGALMDESHGLDLMRYLFGEVDSVYAVVSNYSNLELTSDDCAFLTLKFKDKILSQINFDLVARYPRINLEIVGKMERLYGIELKIIYQFLKLMKINGIGFNLQKMI